MQFRLRTLVIAVPLTVAVFSYTGVLFYRHGSENRAALPWLLLSLPFLGACGGLVAAVVAKANEEKREEMIMVGFLFGTAAVFVCIVIGALLLAP